VAVTEGSILVAEAAAGKKLDTAVVTTAEGAVHREGVVIADPETPERRVTVTAAGAAKTDGSAVTQPVSAASLPLPANAAQEHTTAASPHSARLSDGAAFYDGTKTAQLPAALVGGRLDENVGAWLGSTVPTVGQKGMASSLPVVVASDQSPVPVSTKTALTASVPTFATVGVASAEAIAANASRKGLILVNTSNNDISLGIGAAAVLNRGITLQPGGSWTMNEHSFTTAAVNAIASAAASNLAIQEFTT
jgi:hypothetical protein